MEMSSIFAISFYILIGVLCIVIFVPALYSFLSKPKKAENSLPADNISIPPQFTVLNNEPVYASTINSDSSVQSSLPAQTRPASTTRTKTTQVPAQQPKQSKFAVMNPASMNPDQPQPPVRNWSSHWQ